MMRKKRSKVTVDTFALKSDRAMKKQQPAKTKSATPKRSEQAEIEELIQACSRSVDSQKMRFFSELPISEKTKSGLTNANFLEMTDIQKASLGKSLNECDILGAAKTGSGKTLAFLIPVIEALYRQKWSHLDGLGALIISPTRELALQIFNVLRKIGKNHTLSAGLIIGGKDWEYEKNLINRMSILVCTPGRLLQHMDQTPNFNCDNLQVLVLDEADRILDMGFKKTVNAIIENLPRHRQTLLFSATQTKSVSDLARLSLKDPEYIAVHEKASSSTPETLSQNYLVCQLYEKLDILYSFVKSHLHSKCLVFLSSCKQVRFVYESFCKLQPGTVVMCLHGKQKQQRRNIMFEKFCRAKSAVMICTDIAARGLDFPAVDWVLQADCPEDADSYIHRVGRTARFKANGKALLFLLPSEEEGMSALFERRKIPITKIAVNPTKTTSIIPKLQGLCAESPELKYLAEKAFICYLRSIWLQKDKGIFRISEMPIEEYASSLGLPGAPNIKFIRVSTQYLHVISVLILSEIQNRKESTAKSGKVSTKCKSGTCKRLRRSGCWK
jgi:ATP-dependent RNA helicase DDX10/DBP4